MSCPWYRRAPFRHHGRSVIGALCAYELIALPQRTPLPTISEVVNRHRPLGVVLLTLLGHHWFVELVEIAVEEAVEESSQ